jgi:two-component system, cell cycle sensor histidine kinase and response regulator CckA
VKQSDGYVLVESAPGEGSCFRILLPRLESPAEEPKDPPAAAPLRQGAGTVLVVEDEQAVRAVALRILRRGGYTVLEACNADEALHICSTHNGPIDLILTDVVMPGLSGRDLAERLRPLRPEARVLYMSGYSDERLAGYGVAGETLNLIGKPFNPAALLERVRTVMRGS